MRKIVDYECKHCGSGEMRHSVFDKWCPSPTQSDSELIVPMGTKYLRNVDKPIYRDKK